MEHGKESRGVVLIRNYNELDYMTRANPWKGWGSEILMKERNVIFYYVMVITLEWPNVANEPCR